MSRVEAIAIFCEDIREEASGQVSLIGIFADNLHVPAVPGMLPKLGIYIKMNVPVDLVATEAKVFISEFGGEPQEIAIFDTGIINRAIAEARDAGNPIAGLTVTSISSPCQVPTFGRLVFELQLADERVVIGSLNFIPPPAP